MFLSNRGSFRPERSGAYTLGRGGRRRPKSGSAIGACAVARLAGSGGPIGDYYGSANTREARELRSLERAGTRASEVVQSVGSGYEPPHRARVGRMAPLVSLAAGLDSGMAF